MFAIELKMVPILDKLEILVKVSLLLSVYLLLIQRCRFVTLFSLKPLISIDIKVFL